MKRVATLVALAAMAGALGAVPDSAGRLLLWLGLPGPGSALLADPHWRGVAAYRAADFETAALALAQAGPAADFNRGNALAYAGHYAEALIAYDDVLARDPDDAAARYNHAIVTDLYAGTPLDGEIIPMELKDRDGETVAAEIGRGGARASGAGDEATNTGASFGMPELSSSGLRRVPRIFDDRYLRASDRWLETLEDQPGVYLRARLRAERDRRDKGDAWTGEAAPQ